MLNNVLFPFCIDVRQEERGWEGLCWIGQRHTGSLLSKETEIGEHVVHVNAKILTSL